MDELMRRVAVPYLLLLLLLRQLPVLQPLNTGQQATFPSDRQQFIGFSTNVGVLWAKTNSGDMIYPSNVHTFKVSLST